MDRHTVFFFILLCFSFLVALPTAYYAFRLEKQLRADRLAGENEWEDRFKRFLFKKSPKKDLLYPEVLKILEDKRRGDSALNRFSAGFFVLLAVAAAFTLAGSPFVIPVLVVIIALGLMLTQMARVDSYHQAKMSTLAAARRIDLGFMRSETEWARLMRAKDLNQLYVLLGSIGLAGLSVILEPGNPFLGDANFWHVYGAGIFVGALVFAYIPASLMIGDLRILANTASKRERDKTVAPYKFMTIAAAPLLAVGFVVMMGKLADPVFRPLLYLMMGMELGLMAGAGVLATRHRHLVLDEAGDFRKSRSKDIRGN